MIKLAYPFLYILLLFQCKSGEIGTNSKVAKFGETFALKKDALVKVAGAGETIVLRLTDITDSRCPSDALCMWLGNATVSLAASNSAESIEQIKMCIGDCRPEPTRSKHTMQVQIGNSKYSFTLKEVLPYPVSDKAGEEKMVRMEVEVVEE